MHSGKDSFAHIVYIKRARPEIYARTQAFLSPKDYLTARLTGRLAATFDSIATHWVTDNRDPARIGYDPALVALSGIDREKLPELCAASDVLGPLLPEHRERFGLSGDVVVVGGAPDVHSRRDRRGHDARLRAPSLRRYLVVDRRPRAEKENGHLRTTWRRCPRRSPVATCS